MIMFALFQKKNISVNQAYWDFLQIYQQPKTNKRAHVAIIPTTQTFFPLYAFYYAGNLHAIQISYLNWLQDLSLQYLVFSINPSIIRKGDSST